MKANFAHYTIASSANLIEALAKLNALPGTSMTLFVIDADGRVAGTLTDGDVRRAILAGHALDNSVDTAAHYEFRRLIVPTNDAGADVAQLRQWRQQGITMVPRVDSDGRLYDIVDLSTTHTILPVEAVLMAGGKGERLRPLTLDTPKPLLKIDGKAIIDYNVEALAACGIDNITVATRHMADKISEHFANEVAGIKVQCVSEEQPLGTAGALAMIPHVKGGTTLLMNSDLLTTIDFEEMYLHHRDTGAAVTVAVIPYQVSVPYAIVTTDHDRVTGIEEKPSYSYLANAGIYLINNDIIDSLTPGKRIDATDIVSDTAASGRVVSYYPINGTWIDIGSPTDFAHAAELMRHHRNLSLNKNS